jgi:predicted protein tyrosine phosphatase
MEIRICKRFEVPSVAHEMRATHILSLIDQGAKVYTPSACQGKHLILHMEDIEEKDRLGSPKIEQIAQAIEWARNLPADARVIVHCEAGVSRSTAMAFGVWAVHNPTTDLKIGAEWLKAIRPVACPNLLIAEHIDKLLNFNGEFVTICDGIGEWRMLKIIDEMDNWCLGD